MRPALVVLVLVAMTASARAEFVMCVGGQGFAPKVGSAVPPHARIVYYSDQMVGRAQKVTAKIDGKPVALQRKELVSQPFALLVLDIDSDRSGALTLQFENAAPVAFTVKPVAMPKDVSGFASRYQGPAHPGERGESFDGLAIRLPEATPAVLAHVRMRRDASVQLWNELDVPIYTPDSESRPMIRVGQFDCAPNMPLEILKAGFDLEVSVTLSDGTTRKVTGLAPHMTLPEPLPPQPRPKNARTPG